MTFMDGWRWAARMIEAGFNAKEMTAYASFLIRQEGYRSHRTTGFIAAIDAAWGR
jgi:hypothetical protein